MVLIDTNGIIKQKFQPKSAIKPHNIYFMFKFTCTNKDLEDKSIKSIKFNVTSYLNTVEILVELSKLKCQDKKLTKHRKDIMEMPLCQLYLHAAFYIKLMQLDEGRFFQGTNFEKVCFNKNKYKKGYFH